MTEQQHPITPPLELVEQWRIAPEYASALEKVTMVTMTERRLQEIATQAARWGYEQRGAVNEAKLQKARDEELEACCEWLDFHYPYVGITQLRAARRPKPPSQAEKALARLDGVALPEDAWQAVEAALKRLQELEALDD